MSTGHDHNSRSRRGPYDDPEDTLDPLVDRSKTLVYRDADTGDEEDEDTGPVRGLQQTSDGGFARQSAAHPLPSPFANPQPTPHRPVQAPFAPQPTPFPMAHRPAGQTAGPFHTPSFTPAQGAPQPGFQTGANPAISPAPTFQTGANPAISPAPPFQTGATPAIVHPARPQHVLKPSNLPAENDDVSPGLRVKFALVAMIAGAFVGGLLGILNAKIQGWSIAQGSSELFTLVLAMATVFGAVAFFRPERIEELLVHHGILKLEETSVLSKKTGIMPTIPPASHAMHHGRSVREDDTWPPV
jgi:hypothetical protein